MKYLIDTHMIQSSPENTGLLPSSRKYLTKTNKRERKQAINPLRTTLNTTFNKKAMSKLLKAKEEELTIDYIAEHQEGIIDAYMDFYGEKGKDYLMEEIHASHSFTLAKGLLTHEGKNPRSIHISMEQWEQYQERGGYPDHVFNCQARPDILVFDFDYALTEDQFKAIEKAFKKQLYVIEQNQQKGKKYGNSHIYIQSDDDTTITKVKAGLTNKEDQTLLDIDIFKGKEGYVCGASPSREYTILYDNQPEGSISPRKAITMLAKTLDADLDEKKLEEILTPTSKPQKTTNSKTTTNGEITITTNGELDNERCMTIVENAIPIFTKLAGNGIREELYKSLGGALIKNGFNDNETRQIMTQIYNNTDDTDQRLTTVENTIRKYQNRETITGWPSFQRIVNEYNSTKVRVGGNLQKIADRIFLNKPPVIKRTNVNTGTTEVEVLVGNEDQIFTELEDNTDLYIIENEYNDFKIIVDYKNKSIAKRTIKKDKKGNEIQEDSLIITAVPEQLEVYNDTICDSGKQYKCKWTYNDSTVTEVTGDIILHYKTLLKGAGVWNKNQLQNIISAVFGDLTKTKAHDTILKNTPLQKGFYYDKEEDKLVVVDHEIQRPTKKQLRAALELLDTYGSYFGYMHYNPDGEVGKDYYINLNNEDSPTFKIDPDRLAVFLRWCLNAPFHYMRKQLGMTDDKYIFLSGESGAGKTYGYITAGLFMLGIENPKNTDYIVSGASNSKAQISKNMAKTTFPVFLDEGDHVFNEDVLTSLLKHGVQGLYSREVTDTNTNKLMREPALAPLGFSANNNFDDTEKGGLTNRVIIMPFYTRDIPTKERKKQFEKTFTTNYTPKDKRQVLKWIGYEYQARIMENPKVYIQKSPDDVAKQFFEEICIEHKQEELLTWINNDINTRTAEDDLRERHETLKDVLKIILNKHMQHVYIKDDEVSLTQQPLIDDTHSSWRTKILNLAESQKVSWLKTTKRQDRLIIGSGVIHAIHKENPKININTLEEFRDILQNGKYGVYDVGRYKANINGERKDFYQSLRVEVEVISDLYEEEE